MRFLACLHGDRDDRDAARLRLVLEVHAHRGALAIEHLFAGVVKTHGLQLEFLAVGRNRTAALRIGLDAVSIVEQLQRYRLVGNPDRRQVGTDGVADVDR